jgi:hypothetical protein
VHAFFRDDVFRHRGGVGNMVEGNADAVNGEGSRSNPEVVKFPDFVRMLATFRPLKKNDEKNKLNGREEKLRCEWVT